jgi:four helix bundle protein
VKRKGLKSKSFKDLLVWQRSHEFVLEIYKLTQAFPQKELFGLVSQLRRAAISIPANIAEGFKRKGKADKLRFYNISQASLEEVRYTVFNCRRLAADHRKQSRFDHAK